VGGVGEAILRDSDDFVLLKVFLLYDMEEGGMDQVRALRVIVVAESNFWGTSW